MISVFVTGMVLLSPSVINILRNSDPDRLESIGIYNVINRLKLIHCLASHVITYIFIYLSPCVTFSLQCICSRYGVFFVLCSRQADSHKNLGRFPVYDHIALLINSIFQNDLSIYRVVHIEKYTFLNFPSNF